MRQPTDNTWNSKENREEIKWETCSKYKYGAKTCNYL